MAATKTYYDMATMPATLEVLLNRLQDSAQNYDGTFALDDDLKTVLDYINWLRLEGQVELSLATYARLRTIFSFLPERYSSHMTPAVVDSFMDEFFRKPLFMKRMRTSCDNLLYSVAQAFQRSDRAALIKNVSDLWSASSTFEDLYGDTFDCFDYRERLIAVLRSCCDHISENYKMLYHRLDQGPAFCYCKEILEKDEGPVLLLDLIHFCYNIPLL